MGVKAELTILRNRRPPYQRRKSPSRHLVLRLQARQAQITRTT